MRLGLQKNPKFHQGYYSPTNRDKCLNSEFPIYRSSIELKFFKFCDHNPKVIKWIAEPFPVDYFDKTQNKWRKYYTDAYVEIMEGNELKKYIIEIKPLKDTVEPKSKRGKKKSTLLYEQATYQTNMCKWSFAIDFCKKKNLEFLLLGYTDKNGFEPVSLNL